jgi:LysR family transcriptional regulator, transcription activator of glutamate synthase operon
MELRQLRYVTAIARRLSFTRAAEELSVAQPALSQAIAALEDELHVRLFDRTNRRVALTDAGRAFIARADRIIADVDAASEEMGAFASGLRGRVVVGTYQSFAELRLPKLLAQFHQRYPGVEIALREGMADELLLALRESKVDLFVGDLGDASAIVGRGFVATPLFRDEIAIAVAVDHPFATRKSVRMEELRDEPFVIFRHGSTIHHRLYAIARDAGFEPRVAFESSDSLTLRSLVAERLGIALFPRLLGNVPGPKIALVPLAPKPLMRTMSLLTRDVRYGPAAQRFIDFVKEAHART